MSPSDISYVDARPSIEVGDLDAALTFWTDVVGFETEAVMGEPPFFALVRSGGARLGLSRSDDPVLPAIAPVFVTLHHLDTLIERLAAAGVALESEPTTRPWGIRDLVVRCPGYGPLIAFGEEVTT
jgi:catechol 2,3-dioxygenase-like lactoylglutathione lyase family enzyme